jgi:hypothetical protein
LIQAIQKVITPARFKQITLAAKRRKPLNAAKKCPPPSSSPQRTNGGRSATATITQTRDEESPLMRERIAATPETKATIIKL